MVGSSQHELAKFPTVTLQPVLDLYSSFCIQDFFSFTELIRQFDLKSDPFFLCSFHICSLFTNVPLDETVRICADTLFSGKFIPPDFPKAVFIELMQMATSGVEFSFNSTMYRQTRVVNGPTRSGPNLARTRKFKLESRSSPKIFIVLNVPEKARTVINKFLFNLMQNFDQFYFYKPFVSVTKCTSVTPAKN